MPSLIKVSIVFSTRETECKSSITRSVQRSWRVEGMEICCFGVWIDWIKAKQLFCTITVGFRGDCKNGVSNSSLSWSPIDRATLSLEIQQNESYMFETPSTFSLNDFAETSTSWTTDSEIESTDNTHTSSSKRYIQTFAILIYFASASRIHTLIYRQLHVSILVIIPIRIEFYGFTVAHSPYFGWFLRLKSNQVVCYDSSQYNKRELQSKQ